VTRDLQSTNRYEHSLDSAMRPVRPDGISRRIREHPLRRATPLLGTHCWESIEGDLHWRASRLSDLLEILRATGDPDSMTTCGVSMKTSSETESVATRPPDPGEEIDLTEEYPFKPLSDQEPAGTPLALPRTRSSAHRRLERAPRPPGLSSLCREERPARRTSFGEAGARSLLSSRLPREH
jgi:hypothetical protein